MQFHLLGPVEVVSHGGPIALGGPKPRALLAMLALEAGSTVSSERLIDGLWGDDPPATAAKMVQLYVSHLRKAMTATGEGDAIATRGRGYQLQVSRDQVDAARFERLLAQGAAREALSLWRGPPLGDVADEPFAAAEIRRLDELRSAALEVAIDQDLEAGRHREVLAELESLLAQEPLRERLHAQRMLALYRCGRQADALEAYRQARTTLVEEIGVEPGPELRRLHESILRQDPSLDPPTQDVPFELPGARSPLLGREAELARLRRLWQRTADGAGAVVVITGPHGMGKTRLALDFAGEVRGDILYSGADTALQTLSDARAVRRRTLLVLDDLDRAAPEVHAQLRALMGELAGVPLLVLATAAEAVALPGGEVLALDPLPPDAVLALARFHAGARANAGLPVDPIVADTRGVPALVIGAAAKWARGDAVQRVGEAAARASAEHAGWHAAADDLVAGVVEVQSLGERTMAPAATSACPFKGLASFDVDDAAVFFGRERLIADMVARVAGTRLMAVIGPSGSGKSSAVRAGLLAALADGVLPGSASWPMAVFRPGEHPQRSLERSIAELAPRDRWIVAVDQFEETFTLCRDERERAAFVDALVACARDARRRALVVVALRADFYGHCAAYPELSRMLGSNHVLVGSMDRHELRRAIELPARRAGLRVEPELADALIADVEGESGGLPLLSTALLELWQQRDGVSLRLATYERTGGVRGAVARLAEASYSTLDPPQREQARRIMLRLAGEGGTRARVPIGELDAEPGGVLSVLASDRLITIGDGEAEVAHEALLREWPRLRGWLEEDSEGRRVHRHLTRAARDWNAGGRDAGELYRGSRLAAALEWAGAHEGDLNDGERVFLSASRGAAEDETARQRRANRRLRALLAGIAALLVVALVAGAVAVSQRGQARGAALVADAQRLGAEALTNDRLDQALLLARAGVELDESTATRSSLLAVLLRNPVSLGELRGDGWALFSLAVSPDDRLVAIGDERGGVTIYDTATRRRVGKPYRAPEGLVQYLAFSPDSATVALTVHGEQTLVDLIDSRTGARRMRFELPPFPGRPFYVLAPVVFQPNGRDLIVEQSDVAFPGGPASILRRLNATTGAVEGPPLRLGRHAAYNLVTTPDRRRLFVTSPGDDTTWEIAPETLRVRRTYPVGDAAGAVSADGRMFAVGSQGGAVRVLDLNSGRVRSFHSRHEGSNLRMRFTPDGRTLVTADDRGEVIAWNVARGDVRERFRAHPSEINSIAVSGDGRTLYTVATDARLAIWDLAGDRRLDRRFDAGPALANPDDQYPKGMALSSDGRTLAVAQIDGTVQFLDTRTFEWRRRLRAVRGTATAVDFSPDGRRLAVLSDRGQVTLWDARTLRPAGELRGLQGFSQAIAFSPDGSLLAGADLNPDVNSGVLVWNIRRRELIAPRFRATAASLAFSPDGRLLAASGQEGPTQVRDARSGKLVASLETEDFARSVAFSPDGSLLAVGHYGGSARLWSTRTWKPIGRRMDGHRARLTAVRFSPDGRTLASASADGTVLLWDVGTQRTIGAPLTIEPDTYLAAAFTPHGAQLLVVPHQGRGVRWDVRPEAWKRHACLVAGREFTAREWRDTLPDHPYRSVCRTH